MTEYLIRFEIEADGETPEEAARAALDMLSSMPPPIHATAREPETGRLLNVVTIED